MQTFDRANALFIRSEIEAALKAVGAKHNVNISLGKTKFGPDIVNFAGAATIKRVLGNGHVIQSKEQLDFIKNCFTFGLTREDLGREFVSNGRLFKITGAKPQNHKFPILGETEGGKRFKFSPDQVKYALNRPR